MKTINLNENVKKQFEENHLCYPELKSSKKWGLRGSTLLDRTTEKESLEAVLEYFSEHNLISMIGIKKAEGKSST